MGGMPNCGSRPFVHKTILTCLIAFSVITGYSVRMVYSESKEIVQKKKKKYPVKEQNICTGEDVIILSADLGLHLNVPDYRLPNI